MERFFSLNNLPNGLSLLRLGLSPLLLLVPQEYLVFLFVPLAVSDALDGFLARILKAQTQLGRVLDPLADKVMLTCGLYVCSFRLGFAPEGFFYAVLLRDLFLLAGGALVAGLKGSVPSSRPAGKLFTLLLSLYVVVCLMEICCEWLLWLCAGALIVSWLDYTLYGYRALKSQTSSLS